MSFPARNLHILDGDLPEGPSDLVPEDPKGFPGHSTLGHSLRLHGSPVAGV